MVHVYVSNYSYSYHEQAGVKAAAQAAGKRSCPNNAHLHPRTLACNMYILYVKYILNCACALNIFSEWFTLLCLEDNKQYVSNVKSMETLDGLEVSQDEVQVGDTFVWHYRGAPYKAEIISIHGM